MSINSLKKGNYIVFNDEFPCSILEINKSVPEKHGHAKYNMMGRNLLTGNKHNMVLNHHDRPNFVEVKRRLYVVMMNLGKRVLLWGLNERLGKIDFINL